MFLLWLGFIICTSAIVFSGIRLSRYGDIIAEKTGLGRVWIGLVLMASVTSLPELVTGISSVTFADVPNIAVGDVLGSCVFNMLIIVIIDAHYRISPISTKAHQSNVLSAGFCMLLLSVVALSLHASPYISALGWIGPYSIFFLIIYRIRPGRCCSFPVYKIMPVSHISDLRLCKYRDISLFRFHSNDYTLIS